MSSYQYRKSHCGDKTVVRSSYLHNGISYTDKMSSLYWNGAQIASLGRRGWHVFTRLNTSQWLSIGSPSVTSGLKKNIKKLNPPCTLLAVSAGEPPACSFRNEWMCHIYYKHKMWQPVCKEIRDKKWQMSAVYIYCHDLPFLSRICARTGCSVNCGLCGTCIKVFHLIIISDL